MKQDIIIVKEAVRAEQLFRQGRLQVLRKLARRMANVRLAGVGIVIIVSMLAVALLSDVIAPYDPVKQELMQNLQAPSMQHWLGTDELGRDVLSRVMHASRYSLIVGIASILAASVVGVCLGLFAGFRLGLVGTLLP